MLFPSYGRDTAWSSATSLLSRLRAKSLFQLCEFSPWVYVRQVVRTNGLPLVASAAAFSRLSSSSSASHSICCKRPFFDCDGGLSWAVRWAKLVSTSSSSSDGASAAVGPSDCFWRSRNDDRSTSGSNTSSPVRYDYQHLRWGTLPDTTMDLPSELNYGSGSA